MITSVLIVDDDPTCVLILKTQLNKIQPINNLHIVSNGQEALDKLGILSALQDDSFPEVIFLDIDMPQMNGFEFLEVCHKINCTAGRPVKIIVLSSSINPQDKVKALQLGATQYLVKPPAQESLQAILAVEYRGGHETATGE